MFACIGATPAMQVLSSCLHLGGLQKQFLFTRSSAPTGSLQAVRTVPAAFPTYAPDVEGHLASSGCRGTGPCRSLGEKRTAPAAGRSGGSAE